MATNTTATFLSAPTQWLHPLQIGTSTVFAHSARPATIRAVTALLARLEADDYLAFMQRYYEEGLQKFGDLWGYPDLLTVLHAATTLLKPTHYLEIGVFRGRSMAVVASLAPACHLYGFDRWIDNYAGLPNPGPDLVCSQLQRVGHRGELVLTTGNSQETVPLFLREHPTLFFDVITVDGDHTETGTRTDLLHVLPRLKVGGLLVFDDIRHPQHPWLEEVWDEVVGNNPRFLCEKYTEIGHGVAIALRREAHEPSDPPGGSTWESSTDLRRKVEALQAEREAFKQELATLQTHFATVELDRAARLRVIEDQGHLLGEVEAERNILHARVTDLQQHVTATEAERGAQHARLEAQALTFGTLETERHNLHEVIAEQGRRLDEVEAERTAYDRGSPTSNNTSPLSRRSAPPCRPREKHKTIACEKSKLNARAYERGAPTSSNSSPLSRQVASHSVW